MTKLCLRACRLVSVVSLSVSIVASSLCGVARADDLTAGRSFRVSAAAFSPIGKVFSLGGISINGHPASGEQVIWNGDLLDASDDASVLLNSIGDVRLRRGTTVRLTTRAAGLPGNEGHLLVASLTGGELVIKLARDAQAYIESCGSAFTSTTGATFRVEVLKGEVLVDPANRVAKTESQTRRIYIFRRVNSKYDPAQAKPQPQGADIKKHPGEQEKITLLVKFVDKPTTNQQILFQPGIVAGNAQSTGERPAIGKRILFNLTQPIGELSAAGSPVHTRLQAITITTDGQGLATVIFTAGANPGLANIVATVEDLGQNEETTGWIGHVSIVKAGFWRQHRRSLTIAAAVAAAATIVVVHRNPKPLQQQPPPVIP